MKYFLFSILVIISSCRLVVLDQGQNQSLEYGTKKESRNLSEIRASKKTNEDVEHLLKLALVERTIGGFYPNFEIQLDPNLKDSIRILTSESGKVYLTIGQEANKEVALYSYLDLLGFKFYGPEDHWTYIPKMEDVPEIDTTIVSYFPFRRIAVSYGVARDSTPSLNSSSILYNRWKDRLRMVNLWTIPAGHYGKSFNEKYKKEIQSHPEWMGKDENGNPRKWSPNVKLCYCHPEVIELYKKDALARLKVMKEKQDPPYILNLEPPDSGNFCECDESISDQVYGLANHVAEFLYQYDANAYISLYGYGYHAGAPSFSLHKNVIVGIAPRSVRSGGSPEKMMEIWESLETPLYLRGYLAIPNWTMNKPDYDPHGRFVDEINHLKENHYLGYNFETTSSFMSVGLQFHFLSAASWREVDEEKEYREFLTNMFPGYEEDVSVIYQLLPEFNRQNIILILNQVRRLKDRASAENNSDVKKRLEDLEFYVEYLFLLDRFEREGDESSKDELLDKIMSEPGTRLLHPFGLYNVLKRNTKIARPIERTVNKSVEVQESKEITLSTRSRQKKKYIALNPEFYTDSLSDFHFIPVKNAHGILYVGNDHKGLIRFNARLEPKGYGASGTIIIRDLEDQYIDEINLIPDDTVREFKLKLSGGQFYKIQFLTPETELHLQGPNRPFAFTESLFTRYIYQDAGFYFRVPRETMEVKMRIPRKSNEVIVKKDSKELYSHKHEDAYEFSIPTDEGDIIEVRMRRNGLKLLNIPHILALHKEGVIFESYTE